MRRITLSLATVSLLALSAPAMAQDAATAVEPSETAEGGDIVVTARRREESLLSVPQTVVAVTGKAFQEYNLTRLEDISILIPGLTLTNDNTGIGATASARGVTFVASAQGTPTVENYINEVPVDPNLMFQAQFDIGQIESLKGPQGTQRGRSAPSGALTVTTRRPNLQEFGGSISSLFTNHRGINLQAAINAPIIKDVLAVRVAGLFDYNDQGGVRSINSSDDPYGRSWGIRGTVLFEPTNDIKLVVMGQRLRRRLSPFGQGQVLFGTGAVGVNTAARTGFLTDNLAITNTTASPNQPCAVGDNVPGVGTCGILPGGTPQIMAGANFNGTALAAADELTVADFPSLVDQQFDVVTAQLDWGFAGQKLSYVFGYSLQILDAAQAGPSDVSNTIVGVEAARANNLADSKRLTHELRLSSEDRLFGMLDYTVGLYHGHETGHTLSPTATYWAGAFGSPLGASAAGGPGILRPTTYDARYGLASNRVSSRDTTEKAIFGTLIGHLFDDRLELEAGARQIWYSATKSQETTFDRGLIAIRNPNGLAACPGTLSGVTTSGVNFINAAVVGSTYAGTCDVQTTLRNGYNPSALDQPLATRKWDPLVYRFAASFKISPEFMVYANYGTSWRAGPGPITGAPTCAAALTPGIPDSSGCTPYLLLEPENAKGFEVGLKGSMFDRKLTFSFAAYKQTFDGFFLFNNANPGLYLSGQCIYPHVPGVTLQPASCVPATGSFTFNAPVKTKGIDFDFNFRVNDNFTFGGAASWSDSKFGDAMIPCRDTNFDGQPDNNSITGLTGTQYLNAAAAAAGTSTAPLSAYGAAQCSTSTVPGLKPNSTPHWNFNVRGEYSRDISDRQRGFIRALFNYTPSNTNLNAVTTYIPKAYGLLNLFAGVRAKDGTWEVSAAVRNVLNNRETLALGLQPQTLTRPPSGNPGENLSFAPGTTNLSGYNTISFAPRREFQLSLRYAFGSR